jgi:uncharacterized membrane protein
LAAVLLLSACRGAADAPAAPAIATVRVVGTLDRALRRLAPCDAPGAAAITLAPDSGLALALAALPSSAGEPVVIDVELAPPSGGEPAALASVHTVQAGEGATARCGARPIEAMAVGHEPEWRAWFTAETLTVLRLGGATPDSQRVAAERLPAIDGTIIYRARGGASDAPLALVVSPAASHRGLREGKVQLAERPEGCRDSMVAAWHNASATLRVGDTTWRGCATYAEPRRDPTARRRR